MNNTLIQLVGPAALALLASLCAGPLIIPMLQKLKFGQVIRDEGPQWHLKKSGTPSMGGLIFMVGALVGAGAFAGHGDPVLAVCALSFFGFGLVGFLDDFIKAKKKRNLGLKAWQKASLQLVLAIALALYFTNHVGTSIRLPFTDRQWDMGWLYFPFAVFVIVATVNGTNLTDGLDGLLGSTSLVYFAAFALIFFSGIIPATGELMMICSAMVGALLGFLRFNTYPARTFMGDTGSLAIGGLAAFIALSSKMALWIPIMGGVFLASSLSVILQVASFKLRGNRIFKMAPLHHHFELLGLPETRVVAMYTIVTTALCFIGLLAVR